MNDNWTEEDLIAKGYRPDGKGGYFKPEGIFYVDAGFIPATTMQKPRSKGTAGQQKPVKPTAGGKYHVAPKEERTYNCIVYQSKKESQKAAELDLLVKAGEIDFWLRQVPFLLPGGDKYVADFVTYEELKKASPRYKLWIIKIIEVKGMWTALAKNKFKRFKQAYPNLQVEVC
jgi:hypothetical protein